jgi:hypothetical protein
MPNGRRQAMIFRLRGVARFQDQFEAYQPRGNGMSGQSVWLSFAAFGDSWAEVLTSGASGIERTAKRRHAHCKFIVVALASQFSSKNSSSFQTSTSAQNCSCVSKSRVHSQIAHVL